MKQTVHKVTVIIIFTVTCFLFRKPSYQVIMVIITVMQLGKNPTKSKGNSILHMCLQSKAPFIIHGVYI